MSEPFFCPNLRMTMPEGKCFMGRDEREGYCQPCPRRKMSAGEMITKKDALTKALKGG